MNANPSKGKSPILIERIFPLVFFLFLISVFVLDLLLMVSAPKPTHRPHWINQEFGKEWNECFAHDYSWSYQRLRPLLAEVFLLGLKETQPEVFLGQDRWLYSDLEIRDRQYTSEKRRENLKSNIADLLALQSILKLHQIDLVVAVIPNRLRIYPEFVFKDKQVPFYLKGNYKEFVDMLILNGILTVDLEDALLKARKEDRPGSLLYETLDHHWTSRGCLVSCQAISDLIWMIYPEWCDQQKGFVTLQGPFQGEGNPGFTRHLGLTQDQARKYFIQHTEIYRTVYPRPVSLDVREKSPVILIGDSFAAESPEPLAMPRYLEYFLQSPVQMRYLRHSRDQTPMFDEFFHSETFLQRQKSVLILEFWEAFIAGGRVVQIGPALMEQLRRPDGSIPAFPVKTYRKNTFILSWLRDCFVCELDDGRVESLD